MCVCKWTITTTAAAAAATITTTSSNNTSVKSVFPSQVEEAEARREAG